MRRIYIAGHRGMVGNAVVRRLEARREQGESLELITRTHAERDLTNQGEKRVRSCCLHIRGYGGMLAPWLVRFASNLKARSIT